MTVWIPVGSVMVPMKVQDGGDLPPGCGLALLAVALGCVLALVILTTG